VKNFTLWLYLHAFLQKAIARCFVNDMSEHDIMVTEGHASFAAIHEFYLAVADDLVNRTRAATE
jgi:hypothetical protein